MFFLQLLECPCKKNNPTQTEQPDKKKLRCFREAKRKSKRLDRKILTPTAGGRFPPKKYRPFSGKGSRQETCRRMAGKAVAIR